MHQLINCHLANDEWSKLKIVMRNIFGSPLRDNREVLSDIFSQIVFPKRHWKLLTKGVPDHIIVLLSVVEAISFHGSEESIALFCSKCHCIQAFQIVFKRGTELAKAMSVCILAKLLTRKEDLKFAKLILPFAVQFKDMVVEKNISFEVLQAGVKLIHNVSILQDSEDLILEIFKSGMTPYAIKVLSKCQKLKEDDVPMEDVILISSLLCHSISRVVEAKSDILNKCDVPIFTEAVLKIIKKCSIDLTEHKSQKIEALGVAVLFLSTLIDRLNKSHLTTSLDLQMVTEHGIIKELVPVILLILQDDDLKRSHPGLIFDCYYTISKMIFVEPHVSVIAPALFTILKSFNEDSSNHLNRAGYVATFCYHAVKRGNKKEVKHLIDHGLMPLLAKLRDHLHLDCELYELLFELYFVILKVPETNGFSHFGKGLYNSLFVQFGSYFICPNGELVARARKNGTENTMQTIGFVITALGISCKLTEDEKFKSLDDHFHRNFTEIQEGKIPIELPYPGSFMIKKMAKVKCFKSSVLPHIWYIAEHGPDELIKDLFEALPEAEENTKLATLEEMKEQVLKYVLVEIKEVFERKLNYKISMLIRITQFLISIPCKEQCDTVLYHLEDLVSPCLGLLEDQNNKIIIENVKKFINNLHYS